MPTDTLMIAQNLRRISQILILAGTTAALYWGREILLPIMLAVLLAFLLTPATRGLERCGLHRLSAVIVVVLVSLAAGNGLIWVAASQLMDVSAKMPQYKGNLLAKARLARQAAQSSLTQAAETIQDLGQELERDKERPAIKSASLSQRVIDFLDQGDHRPKSAEHALDVRVVALPPSPIAQIRSWLGPLVAPLASAGMVVVLVIFLLIHREDLRNRLLQLVGTRHLHDSTMAINEAGRRVSQYLRMQLLLNTLYGTSIAVGLWCIGIPNALLWGVLGIAFRFVPYLGPWLIFSVPFTLSLAVSETWFAPLATLGLFVVLELILNNILEPWLYGRGTGVSSFGIIVSVIFWAWMWGPVGLVLATPITVCLVVMGRHFPPLQFIATVFGEDETLQPHERLYQRLLVDDWDEVLSIVEESTRGSSPFAFLDQLILPVLQWIEVARNEDRLSDDRADRMIESVVVLARNVDCEELELSEANGRTPGSSDVLITAGRDATDQALATIFHELLERVGCASEFMSKDILVGELLQRISDRPASHLVAVTISPAAEPYALYLAKRLRERPSQLHVLVHRTDESAMARSRTRLERAGATSVESHFSELCDRLNPRKVCTIEDQSLELCVVRHQGT